MKAELLSPVGNMKCLKAAINANCDAVYLSGINFGARSFAGNFSNEELIEAIKICHLYGVKVYVTVNTLIYDVEVERFLNYIDFIYKNNVDAVIMQDIGMIDLVRKTYPKLEIHASTQLHIHNLEGAKLCESLGIKRVVLARETPIELVCEIKNSTNIEIEIFIQGALCMSYSGECLMSYLIGGRSGNRGTCAQPCRQKYSLEIDGKVVEDNKYLLSTKDLSVLENIEDLIKAGVDSFKIEGRMKGAEYVFLTTSIYRKCIDSYFSHNKVIINFDYVKRLMKVFNREFTKGFLFGEDNDNFANSYRPNHVGVPLGEIVKCKDNMIEIKLIEDLSVNDGIRILGEEDIGQTVTAIYNKGSKVLNAHSGDEVSIPFNMLDKVKVYSKVVKTTDYNELKSIRGLIDIDKKIYIEGVCTLKIGFPIEFKVKDLENETIFKSNFIVEKSFNNETSLCDIKLQLSKLGGTIYKYKSLDIIKDSNIFIPISKLNEARREALNLLNEKRLCKKEYIKKEYQINLSDYSIENSKNILLHSYEQYLKNKDLYDIIYIDSLEEYKKINSKKCILRLPRVCEHLEEFQSKVLVCELGGVYKYKEIDTDFSLNIVNSYSVAFLHSIGVNKITLSYELNYKQIKNLIENYIKRYNKRPNLEVIVEAHEEAMVCKYNMLKKYNKNEAKLRDIFGNSYKIKVQNNLMYIYNFKRRKLTENYFDIGINNIRVNL